MLKSAILAAKKKNNLSDEILYLTGEEDAGVVISAKTQQTENKSVSKLEKAAVPQKAKINKTPSLKDAMSKINSIGSSNAIDSNEEVDSKVKAKSALKNAFSLEELEGLWDVFVERLSKKQPRMYSAFKTIKPVLLENEVVELAFQNNAQLEVFVSKFRPELLWEFRDKLRNDFIEISERVIDTEKMERPKLYSDKEKLQLMVDKNPALQLLKNKFNLDFE